MESNYNLNGEILKGSQVEDIKKQILQIFVSERISVQFAKFILEETKEQIEKTIIS